MTIRLSLTRALATFGVACLGATALVAASTVLAAPASAAAPSYQVFVAGQDGGNGEAEVKVLTMPAGTADTIDLGAGTTQAYGVAVNASGAEAFATVAYGCDGTCFEVIPISGPFTFTSGGAFNGTVGAPVLTYATTGAIDGSDFDIDSGIVVSGDVVAVVNDFGYGNSGVYLFNDTLASGQGSAADPEYVNLAYQPTAITADASGLIAVDGEGTAVFTTPTGCQTTIFIQSSPGCVSTFSVASLTTTPTPQTTTLFYGLGASNVNCAGGSCTGAPAPGAQSIVISPANGDIYVADSENLGVWQVNPPYTSPYGFQYISGPTALQAITIDTAGDALYLGDGVDPHSYQVFLVNHEVPGPSAVPSENLGTGDTGGPNLVGIGLSPDGSEALVLDGDDSSGSGTTYLDQIPTDSFTGSFHQSDPPVAANGMYVTSATISVAASSTIPVTGAELPIGLGLLLLLSGCGVLMISRSKGRRLPT